MIREPDIRNNTVVNSVPDYSSAFEAIAQDLREQELAVDAERQAAETLLGELKAMPAGRRGLLASNSERFRNLSLCQALVKESHRLGFEDPVESLALAELATVLADRLDPQTYPAGSLADVRGRCWSQLGNALRINSDFPASNEAFSIARAHLQEGTGDRLDLAWLLDLVATLRKYENRIEESMKLQTTAIGLYQEVGDSHLMGRALIKMATLHSAKGDTEKVMTCLDRGLSLIDLKSEPVLASSASQTLTLALLEAGRPEEALVTLHRSRQLLEQLGDQQLPRLRFRWLEGNVAMQLGRLSQAEKALRVARQGFLRLGLSFEFAMLSMELAQIYARRNRTAELKQLVGEMLPIFESRALHDDAMAALLLFRQAVETERATLGLIEEVRTYLEESQHDQKLRFCPSSH